MEVNWRALGHLESTWRPLGSHPGNKVLPRPHFDDLGSILGPPNQSNIDHFLIPIWMQFWDPLFDGLGLRLGSQNTSKMKPKTEP